jgi:hypothetical protein
LQFSWHGYLPPGIHPATLEEVEARFGGESDLRRVQMAGGYCPSRWCCPGGHQRKGMVEIAP